MDKLWIAYMGCDDSKYDQFEICATKEIAEELVRRHEPRSHENWGDVYGCEVITELPPLEEEDLD